MGLVREDHGSDILLLFHLSSVNLNDDVRKRGAYYELWLTKRRWNSIHSTSREIYRLFICQSCQNVNEYMHVQNTGVYCFNNTCSIIVVYVAQA